MENEFDIEEENDIDKKPLSKTDKAREKRLSQENIKVSTYIGSVIWLVVGIWLIIKTYTVPLVVSTGFVIGVAIVVFAIFQSIWVHFRKRLNAFERIFFSAINYVSTLIEDICFI